jgi:signal peptidase I
MRRFALIAGVAAAVLVVRGRPFRAVVRGSSMEPTLHDGDSVIGLGGRRPRRGRVAVAVHPRRPGFEMVKRVAGVPRDVVQVLPDGSRLAEPVPLGAGEWFLLGDAPGDSTDSRSFGPVRGEHIRGVVVLPLRAARSTR